VEKGKFIDIRKYCQQQVPKSAAELLADACLRGRKRPNSFADAFSSHNPSGKTLPELLMENRQQHHGSKNAHRYETMPQPGTFETERDELLSMLEHHPDEFRQATTFIQRLEELGAEAAIGIPEPLARAAIEGNNRLILTHLQNTLKILRAGR